MTTWLRHGGKTDPCLLCKCVILVSVKASWLRHFALNISKQLVVEYFFRDWKKTNIRINWFHTAALEMWETLFPLQRASQRVGGKHIKTAGKLKIQVLSNLAATGKNQEFHFKESRATKKEAFKNVQGPLTGYAGQKSIQIVRPLF